MSAACECVVLGNAREQAYVALECHALIDTEEQDDMSAGVKSFCKKTLVLLLSGPQPISHGLCDVIVVP